jgi:DNA-binding CsgD family transcriptional regulator
MCGRGAPNVTVHPRRPLTKKQRRVADCFARGLDTTQTAAKLGLDPSTVRNHISAIANLLPNPDNLRPARAVFLWAAHRLWEEEHPSRRLTFRSG